MVERTVEFDGNRVKLLGVCRALVDFVQLDVVGQTLENEIAVRVVDHKAKLVVIHVLLNVVHCYQNVCVVRLLFHSHSAVEIDQESNEANQSECN